MSQQEPQQFPSDRQMRGALMWVCQGIAMSVQVFVRRGFGPQLLSVRGGMAALILFLVTGFGKDRGLFYYMLAFLFMLLVQRIHTTKLLRQGMRTHSRYDGVPVLAMTFTRKEETAKGIVEPFLCIAIGIGIAIFGEAHQIPGMPSIGGWVMLGGMHGHRRGGLSGGAQSSPHDDRGPGDRKRGVHGGTAPEKEEVSHGRGEKAGADREDIQRHR